MISFKACTAASALTALAMLASPATAQSNEETLSFDVEINVNLPSATITGLGDMSLSINELLAESEDVRAIQRFCLFAPYEVAKIKMTGANPAANGLFVLKDGSQSDPDLQQLKYTVDINYVLGADPILPGDLTNNGQYYEVNTSRFNTDATCTGGENLALKLTIDSSGKPESGPSNFANGQIIARVADGLPHLYTDQLTILVEQPLF